MTSSYSNIIGTPRDQIPDISDTNWEDVTPDLSKAANASITDNQDELKTFLADLGQIEKKMADADFNKLTQLDQLLGEGAKLKKLRDADKESRETIKRFRKLSKDAKAKLSELEDLSELTETELHAELRKLAFNEKTGEVDEQALEFLKLQYFPTGEEIDFESVKEVYNKHGASAFNTNIEENFIYSAATEAQANSISDKAITNIVTKLYLDLNAKGLDINSREVQKYINRQLLPELAKEQASAISTYKQTTLKRYYKNVDRKRDNIILNAATSSSVVEQPDGTKKVVHDGNLDNVISKIQKIDGVNKQEALQIFLDRLPSLKNKLTPGGLEYLLNDVKITHSSGTIITGLDSPEADKLLKGNVGNVIELKRLQSEVIQSKDAIVKRINGSYESWFRENRKENNGQHLIETENGKNKVLEKVAEYRLEMSNNGVDIRAIEIPGYFFGDETVTTNTGYSIKEKTWKNINNRSWESDWIAGETEQPLEGTRDIQVSKAKQWLENGLKVARAANPTLNEAEWVATNYPEAIKKLKKGDFKPDKNDFLILPTAELLQEEKKKFMNDPKKWMNNTEVNSLEEKQALGELVEWRNNGYKGPIPGYFTTVGTANGQSGLQYGITRLKALGLWDEKADNFKDPEEFLKLSDEDLKTLTIKPNFTKNHLILNPTDEDRTAEANVLNILRKATPGRKVDHVGEKTGTWRGAGMLLEWATPGTDIRSVATIYRMAKSGKFDDFGIYGLTSEELIQAVDSGVVDMDDDFDENTQDFLAMNLIRVKANQQTSIQGAVTEGYDWRRLVNLNRAEKAAVLKFFPNLHKKNMSLSQFQDLQPDISLAILNDVEKKFQTVKAGDAITSKEEGLFTRAYIQANPEFSFLNKGLSEETINAELEGNTDAIVNQILKANTFVGKQHEERLITTRIFFENRIKEGKPVPEEIRRALQGTRNMYRGGEWIGNTNLQGNQLNYKDDFDYFQSEKKKKELQRLGYDDEKFKLIMGDDGKYRVVPKDEEKK
jgi:hypothetical protein